MFCINVNNLSTTFIVEYDRVGRNGPSVLYTGDYQVYQLAGSKGCSVGYFAGRHKKTGEGLGLEMAIVVKGDDEVYISIPPEKAGIEQEEMVDIFRIDVNRLLQKHAKPTHVGNMLYYILKVARDMTGKIVDKYQTMTIADRDELFEAIINDYYDSEYYDLGLKLNPIWLSKTDVALPKEPLEIDKNLVWEEVIVIPPPEKLITDTDTETENEMEAVEIVKPRAAAKMSIGLDGSISVNKLTEPKAIYAATGTSIDVWTEIFGKMLLDADVRQSVTELGHKMRSQSGFGTYAASMYYAYKMDAKGVTLPGINLNILRNNCDHALNKYLESSNEAFRGLLEDIIHYSGIAWGYPKIVVIMQLIDVFTTAEVSEDRDYLFYTLTELINKAVEYVKEDIRSSEADNQEEVAETETKTVVKISETDNETVMDVYVSEGTEETMMINRETVRRTVAAAVGLVSKSIDHIGIENVKADEVMAIAINTISDRGDTYDKAGEERSFEAVAIAFNAITRVGITPAEVALILQLVKDVRQWSSPDIHPDSAIDSIAYAGLKSEELMREGNNKQSKVRG